MTEHLIYVHSEELEQVLAGFRNLNKNLDRPIYDASIPILLNECLEKAGTEPGWHSLRKHMLVNGRPVPDSQPPPDGFWELGHYFQQFEDHILWQGLSMDSGAHTCDHTARIYPNGIVVGYINCFRLGKQAIEAGYLKGHLDAWKGRIKTKPYWDEIDHVPIKK